MTSTIKERYREFFTAALAAAAVVGFYMLLRVRPSCGYHLVDDHEFLAWNYLLESGRRSISELISEYTRANIAAGRWRPLYLVIRGLFMVLFGTDIRRYYILAYIKACVTYVLIYYMARLMKAGRLRAHLTSLIALLGYQSCTWWKLGTHEIVSTMWFSAGMIFLIRYLEHGRKYNAVLSILSFTVMSLYKESFIVLIPFVILYVIYHETSPEDFSRERAKRSIIRILKSRWRLLAVLSVIFIVNIGIILSLIGLEYMPDSAEGLRPLLDSFGTDMKWFIRLGAVMLAILISRDIESLKIWREFILFVVFIAPQFYLFRTTGITERYLLPFSLGYAIFFCVLAPLNMDIGRIRGYIYSAILVLLVIVHARSALIEADYFHYRGESVTAMLDTVCELSETDADIRVLSALYYEGGYTIYANNLLNGFDNIYEFVNDWTDLSYQIRPVEYSHYIYFNTSQPLLDDISDIDVIVAYNHQDRHWSYDIEDYLGEILNDFEKTECGTLDVYVRR